MPKFFSHPFFGTLSPKKYSEISAKWPANLSGLKDPQISWTLSSTTRIQAEPNDLQAWLIYFLLISDIVLLIFLKKNIFKSLFGWISFFLWESMLPPISFFWLGQTCVKGENYVNVLQNNCSNFYIYIEIGLSYTKYNFVHVTHFLYHRFIGNLTVKKTY